ncbi:MAG: protein kinase [Polyangiaceae bacterium]|nr:protein kinase [Polyangiaceae bacterium]
MKVCPQCKQRYPHESSFCFVDGVSLEALPDPRLGTTVAGRYVLEHVLGEGGMATVYGARHKLVERPCAVKILHGEVTRDPNVRERFRREARHAQRLAHPNIIEVYDQGETEEGTAFLVMELLQGQSLAHMISVNKMPLVRVLKLGVQMVRALARAHDFEVVHRDLKPENVFVMAGDRIKLLDFGIARSTQDSRLTSVGEIFGTPEYMAPEQGTSTDAGPAADIYSLGIIFFEMVSGTLPFEAPNAPTMLVKHLSEPAPRLRSREPSVPESFDELVFDMMAKTPAERPVDAQSVLVRLLKIAEELNVKLPADSEPEPAPQSRQLRPAEAQIWERRAKLFDEMIKRGFPSAAPADLSRMLGELRTKVTEVHELRSKAFDEQQKLEVIESEGRDGRVRFGQAMDTLSADASKLREEARALRQGAAQNGSQASGEFAQQLKTAHKQAIFWEGRSAFIEPYMELAKAYRECADVVEAWYQSRQKEKEGERAAQDIDAQLVDLDFQIKELRAGLEAHDRDVEDRRQDSREQIGEMGRRAEQLEAELLILATRFCAPLRAKPELVPLFRDLEAAG